MNFTGSSGRPGREDVTPLMALSGARPGLIPLMTRMKGCQAKVATFGNNEVSDPYASRTLDTEAALALLRGGVGDSSWTKAGTSGGSGSEATSSPPSPTLNSAEIGQGKRMDPLSNKRRRRGLAALQSTLSAWSVQSPFLQPIFGWNEENKESVAAVEALKQSASGVTAEEAGYPPCFRYEESEDGVGSEDGKSFRENLVENAQVRITATQRGQGHKEGERVTPDRGGGTGDGGGGGGGPHSGGRLANSSSSSLNGSAAAPVERDSQRELGAHMPESIAWTTGGPPDGSSDTLLPPGTTGGQPGCEQASDFFESAQRINSKEPWYNDADADSRIPFGRNGVTDGGRFYREGPKELRTLVEKMGPLSRETLQQLSAHWPKSKSDSGDDYCLIIAKRIRSFETFIVTSACRSVYPSSQGSKPASNSQRSNRNKGNTNQGDGTPESCKKDNAVVSSGNGTNSLAGLPLMGGETLEGLTAVLPRLLGRDVCTLGGKNAYHLSKLCGVEGKPCSQTDLLLASGAFGTLMFFSLMPAPLLKKVCQELSIFTGDHCFGSTDPNQHADILAEMLSKHFYPLQYTIPPLNKLSFLPQMQIHEHAPGRYTCTIDNAECMRGLPMHRLISNRFNCNKIRWYAALMLDDEDLSFYVWHRHTMPLHIHMVVRTQDPKKKRKGNNQPNASNNNSGNGGMEESLNQATLKERSALFLEKEAEAAPGQMVGFVNFVQVQTALQSSTAMQCGYRLFNAAEGRLIFQCAINLLNRDDATQAESSDTKATTDPKSSKGGDPSQAIESLKREAASGAQQTPATEASAASAIEEKRRKELERAIQKLERGETQDREAIKKLWSSAHRHLADEYNKACQRAAQKKKERERKTLLAKVGPSPELQRELNSLMQTVATHTNQVTKLMKEKAKEEENMQKLKQRIEDGNRELKTLRQQLKSHGETLANINEEINVLTNRKQEREELRRLKAPDLSAALHIPEPGATRHETLAINDFQSFWATSAPRGSSPQVMMDLPASTHSTPQRHSPGQVATVAHAISPVDGGSNSSNAGGPSIPLPRSAVMLNGGCSYPQTVSGGTSSADYFSGGLPSWGSLADALSFTATCNDSSNGGVFGVANSTVPTCSTSPQQQRQKSIDISQLASELCDETPATQSKADPSAGGGFTVTAHFSAPEQASRFMLDVNAHPYTPTPLTSSQATGVAVLHSNFTNAPLLHLSPSTKSPSSAYVGSASPPSGGGVFPEKPRYTSVSTPVATSGSTGNNGLFGVAPFGILGSSNGSLGCRPDSGPLLNFTTAPWN